MRVRFAVGGILLLLLAGLFSGCVPPDSYVALGDSFTSGPLIPEQNQDYPGCFRSDSNYPSLIAPDVNQPRFRDVSCSGAQTKDMTGSQDVDPDPDNPPQFNALDENTRIVTLGIGGNDIGFVDIATKCGELFVTNPLAVSPCKDHYTQTGEIDTAMDALALDLRAVLDGIESRSPKAKVFTIGYPAILPENTILFELCQATLPVAKGDVPFLRDEVEKRLNSTIKQVTQAHGDIYVDTYTGSIGHDACQPAEPVGGRWVEPVVPGNLAFPVHPNSYGMEGTAAAVRAAMRTSGFTGG